MEQTVTLAHRSPQDALRTINAIVSARYNWQIMTGGSHDQPKFVIQRRISHMLVRGFNTHTQFTLSGRFTKAKSGDIQLHYEVTGQPVMTALLASSWLLIVPVFIGLILSLPMVSASVPIAWGLVAFLLVVAGLYVWLSVRSYQYHLREMHQLIANLSRDELFEKV